MKQKLYYKKIIFSNHYQKESVSNHYDPLNVSIFLYCMPVL